MPMSILVKLHQGEWYGNLPHRQWADNTRVLLPATRLLNENMKISQVVQRYHNPDPLLRLIGPATEATIIVVGQRLLALIDSGVQLSMMLESLVQALVLPVHKLNTLIEAEASGGGIIPYVYYIQARLAIPGIEKMNKDSLFMVSNDSPYTSRVLIQLGTLHIWEALWLATKEEKETLPQAWETANFPLQTVAKSGILKEPEFDLNKVKRDVKLTKSITIRPFQTVHFWPVHFWNVLSILKG